jgi:hypothetical protein
MAFSTVRSAPPLPAAEHAAEHASGNFVQANAAVCFLRLSPHRYLHGAVGDAAVRPACHVLQSIRATVL